MTHETESPKGRFSMAFADYRALILLGLAYIVAICGEAYVYGVPAHEFIKFIRTSMALIARLLVLLSGFGFYYFIRRLFDGAVVRGGRGRIIHAWDKLNTAGESYFSGRLFAYGMIGILAVLPLDFFFIEKSLVHFVNPYSWDQKFVAWEKIIHFGTTPNQLVLNLVKCVPSLAIFFDLAYLLWFGAMFTILFYNLMIDKDLKRRLRYLWVFILCWIVLGSVLATMFSCVGPIFYHDFYPNLPDPYIALRAYMDKYGPDDFPVSYASREYLLFWTTRGDLINPNAIIAFPSMHMAIAWLNVLYCWGLNRFLGGLALAFSLLIFGATMLNGFHYGLDIYVSIAVVSAMWWISGIIANAKYGKDNKPQLTT